MIEKLIYFKYNNIEKPIIKITDNENNQVVLNFLPYDREHLTLHLQEDGMILRTHSGENKPKRSWDDERVIVANVLGYKNPEKHSKYFAHSPIGKISDNKELHLVGRQICINDAPHEKAKYKKLHKITLNIKQETVMAGIYLYTDNKETVGGVSTSLGIISIRFDT